MSMLSFRVEMTHGDLERMVLPPSLIWMSRFNLGVEWLLWPEPTAEEEAQLKGLMVRYAEPDQGNVLWDKELIYPPKDMIAALTLPKEIREFVLGFGSDLSLKTFLSKEYFTFETLKIITSMTPLGLRVWEVPYPRKVYPDSLMKKIRKWR